MEVGMERRMGLYPALAKVLEDTQKAVRLRQRQLRAVAGILEEKYRGGVGAGLGPVSKVAVAAENLKMICSHHVPHYDEICVDSDDTYQYMAGRYTNSGHYAWMLLADAVRAGIGAGSEAGVAELVEELSAWDDEMREAVCEAGVETCAWVVGRFCRANRVHISAQARELHTLARVLEDTLGRS